MFAHFVATHRAAIIARTTARVLSRSFRPSDALLADGVPVFLTQLGEALRLDRDSGVVDHEQMKRSAGRHGGDLLRLGLTIGQVVQCYGDVCQVITELAAEESFSISPGDFRTLNLCLDDATARAVTEYSAQHDLMIAGQTTERLGILAHELRNLLNTAFLSYEILKSGRVAVAGSTGMVLGKSLLGIRNLIDISLADVRLEAGIEEAETISTADLVGDVQIGASLQAEARGLRLDVTLGETVAYVSGDRQILAAALSNLLQNAFKFTHKGSLVRLRVAPTEQRVLFEVEDECGGLPPGKAEDLFRPFSRKGGDRSGLGLGLAICLRAAAASAGELRVRDMPGTGCVFTLDLPRRAAPLVLALPPATKGAVRGRISGVSGRVE